MGTIYRYYKCGGAKRKKGCTLKAVKKEWIEYTVVQLTVSMVLQDTVIDRIADAIFRLQDEEDTMTPVIKQQLNNCETEIQNVMTAIRKGIITETTKTALDELETQREHLRTSLAQIQLERHKFTKEEIVAWISQFKNGDINDVSFQKEIIDVFVNSVYVYDDKLLLTFNYKDGTRTITLEEINTILSSDTSNCIQPEKRTLRFAKSFFQQDKSLGDL